MPDDLPRAASHSIALGCSGNQGKAPALQSSGDRWSKINSQSPAMSVEDKPGSSPTSDTAPLALQEQPASRLMPPQSPPGRQPRDQPHQPLRTRPSTATLSRLLKKPSLIGPLLRGMQSFDSGRTERQSPTAAAGPKGSSESSPETPPRADPVSGHLASCGFDVTDEPVGVPALWEWLASSVAEDDPRFVLWRSARGNGGRSPTTPTLSPASAALSESDATAAAAAIIVGRQLLAASLSRWIHQLTSALDSDGAFDFLLVYRRFCSPMTLLALLTSRFEWACGLTQPPTTSATATEVKSERSPDLAASSAPELLLARTRTMRVLAFWLTTFFEEDWLPSVNLRRQLTIWLNGLRHRPELDGVLGARSLLKRLKAVVKDRKRAFDTPAGQTVYEARATAMSATSLSSAEGESVRNGERGPKPSQTAGSLRRTDLVPAADPPPLFPTRRKALSTFSPPSSPPAPLPKHGMSKLWGSIGRAATRSRLSAGLPPIKSSPIGPYAAVAGASNSFDDLFHTPIGGPPASDDLASKQGLDPYLHATSHATQLEPTAPSPTSMSDPESRSSHSSSTVATTTSDRSDEIELEPSLALRSLAPASPLEKVEEERSSYEMVLPERRSSLGHIDARLTVDPTSDLLPERELASAEPSPIDSTFSTATSSRLDVRSLASSCSSDDADFRVPKRSNTSITVPQPSSGGGAITAAKPTWTPIVPFATIAFDRVSFSDSDDDDSWESHPSSSLDAASDINPSRRQQQLNLGRQSMGAVNLSNDQRPYLIPQPGSTDSLVTNPTTGRHRVSRPGSADSSTSSDRGAWRNSLLARFDLKALESDAASEASDDGGVEAALRRLNGDYDVEKRRAREARIERLVAANRDAWRRHEPLPVHRRHASVDFDLIEPGSSLDDDFVSGLGFGPPVLSKAGSDPVAAVKPSLSRECSTASDTVSHSFDPASRRVSAPVPYRPAFSPSSSSGPSSFIFGRKRSSTQESLSALAQPGPSSPHKPLAGGAGSATSPLKTGRRLSFTRRGRPDSVSPVANAAQTAGAAMSRALFSSTQPTLRYQSFIFSFKTSVLAAQFSIIDAQLLNAVGFEELARKPAPWVANPPPSLDSWEDLWREKARWKLERSARPSDVGMIIRRFELVVRWVETELVLTARAGRSSLTTLVERFIKLAAALFQLSNLQSCVAIMHGLQTPIVDKLMQAHKAWPRLALWERHVFKDLRLITSAESCWINLRKAHASILDRHAGRLFEDVLLGSAAASPGATTPSQMKADTSRSLTGATREDAFLPFMDTYLHDLGQLEDYPDFVAPRIFEAERDHLPPLPASLRSDVPLINVDKAKQHARIIRQICLFKTLAARFGTIPAEPASFQLCFKLRAAPPDAIAVLAQIASPQ